MSEKAKQITHKILDTSLVILFSGAIIALTFYIGYQALVSHEMWALAVVIIVPPVVAFFAWSMVRVGAQSEEEAQREAS